MMDTSSRRAFFRNSLLLGSLACRGGAEDVANAQGSARGVIDDARNEPVGALTPVPALAPGARIALAAPGGALAGRTDLDRAMANVRRCGWEPVAGTNALARDGYFAGSDQQRLDDINAALNDDQIDAIWCLRGGYGLSRIVDTIDYAALTRRPKAIIGYSDITVLHVAVAAKCNLVTYHGPVARESLLPFSEQSLLRALRHRDDPVGFAPESRTVRSGIAQGRLAGGNLTMLAALAGTAFQADLRGTIVVLEDTGVPVYAIDRMLQQLIMSGSMQSIAGIAFGQLTAMHGSTDPAVDRQLTTTLRNVATTLDVPCLAGLPIGHIDAQWTLPLGRMATLDADAQTVTLHA